MDKIIIEFKTYDSYYDCSRTNQFVVSSDEVCYKKLRNYIEKILTERSEQ